MAGSHAKLHTVKLFFIIICRLYTVDIYAPADFAGGSDDSLAVHSYPFVIYFFPRHRKAMLIYKI